MNLALKFSEHMLGNSCPDRIGILYYGLRFLKDDQRERSLLIRREWKGLTERGLTLLRRGNRPTREKIFGRDLLRNAASRPALSKGISDQSRQSATRQPALGIGSSSESDMDSIWATPTRVVGRFMRFACSA